MSLSNSSYGTPAFQRSASTGLNTGGGAEGVFTPPLLGASNGGYYPFPPFPSREYGTKVSQSQLHPSNLVHSHQSQSAQFRSPLSPYHPSQWAEYQTQHVQQPDPTPWTYAQYPPSPGYPVTTPVTINPTSHYLPHSAPPQITSWSQYSYQPRYQYSSHQSPRTQQHFNHLHDQSHYSRPAHERHRSSNLPESIPLTGAGFHQSNLPFSGSANAPTPKKSALKQSHSHSVAVGRPNALGSRPRTPRIHHDSSSESDLNTGFSGIDWSVWPAPVVYPTMIPTSAPVMPLTLYPYVPRYALHDQEPWSSDNLSPRPRDWRADYVPKQGISLYLPRIGRVKSDVEEYIDTVKRNLHPVLRHSSESEVLSFDLRYQIIEGHTLMITRNEVDLAQLAAYPPAPVLRLYHPKFPWYIDIHQSHPTGVTVFDVLAQMSLQMQAPIHNRHYHNDVLDSADRAALGKAYKERCRGRSGQSRKGIFQVDFLGEKFVFSGLARGKQGMWEIKSRRVGDHHT